MWKESN